MFIEMDFDSEEALYMQLHDQIILGIAKSLINEGDQLPSVRSMAEEIGINMHTVNKAYALLRDEGFLHLDQRRGAVISIDMKKIENMTHFKNDLKIIMARAVLKGISRDEIHEAVDEICDEWQIEFGKEA
ncbi:MAG: GntR family transcriptional regulator [Lachnospiraceae bacterium]|nr:GntR family transcriptional regulator [Lachnospiraceae bacterium]MBR1876996.1 GntR family transcriptional regulator [Lachnospiraceae bacterium]